LVDKEANKEIRIRHYNNYLGLLEKTKIKTNAEMARRTGIDPSTLSDWKNGVSEPKMDKIVAIAKVLRVNPNKIID